MENFLVYGGALLALAGVIYGYLKLSSLVKGGKPEKPLLLQSLIALIAVTLGAVGLIAGVILNNPTALSGRDLALALIGATLTMFLFVGMVGCFIVHFYKKDASKELKTWSWKILLMSILPLILSFVVMMEGIDALMDFPMTKAIYFGSTRIVTFYALFILTGAGIVYFVADHQLHSEGYRKGILENVFYVAFPAGIIGSRIWYVIGQWESEFAGRDLWHIFATWEGGLTIIGGALFGTIAGVLFVKFRRKELNLLHVMDVVVPAILIAQGVGRWGNFFNQEVYGGITDPAKWWFLPNFIIQQMTVSGEMRVPLFLIESLANFAGYFIIRYAVGVGLKKYIVQGDLAALYPIWYGVTRVIMEPMRDSQYIMDDWWSLYGSYGLIAVGVLAIVYLHVTDYLKKKKAKDTKNAPGSLQK